MTLSASSALFHWDSRHGEIPIIGGDPTHTRASAGVIEDERGMLYNAIINTPRRGWDTIDGVRRQTLLLEGSYTNRMNFSEDFRQWTAGSASLTRPGGFRDPFGGVNAYFIGSSAASDNVRYLCNFQANGRKTVSLFVKQGTATSARVRLYDATVSNSIMGVLITWTGIGNPPTTVIDSGAGTVHSVVEYNGGWYRIAFTTTASVTATDSMNVYVYTNLTANTSGYYFGAQAEDGTYPTSYIATNGSAATRAADVFYFEGSAPDPQAMAYYVRFVDVGSAANPGSNTRVSMLENSSSGNPKLGWYVSVPGTYQFYHNNNTTTVAQNAFFANVFYGDVIELLGLMSPTGAVTAIASQNGGTGVISATSPANTINTAGWSAARIGVNSAGSSFQGQARFSDIRIVKYADLNITTADDMLRQLRDFELSPSGDLL